MAFNWEQSLLMLVLLAVFLLSPLDALPLTGSDIELNPSAFGQGEVALLSIRQRERVRPKVTWRGKDIAVFLDGSNSMWAAFLGADLTTVPGRYTLKIRYGDDVLTRRIPVISKDHGIRRFKVPKEMEALDDPTLERVRKESKVMMELFSHSRVQPLWWGRWISPVSGAMVSPFGCRTFINDLERSPHSGVDLKAAEGTSIKATNRGQVVLVADQFFGGLSVVIDHGGGIHSMYFHLSEVSVASGMLVERGDLIGLAGSSGRATGPHLHFGIRLNGERVNPLSLIELSAGLGR
ncbi:MAG: M23 family peptidase [Deltaproteobacteria bacterium]|nr:MAG: M23 family peptidase [Deltaproteobacteria bacterium]